jgi:hypothetical protein
MNPRRYRTRLLLDATRLLVLPATVLAALRCLSGSRHNGLTPLYYLSFVVLWAFARGLYSDYVQSEGARRLGAQRIPRVVGRWPGNIDILLRIMRSYKTDYLLDFYKELFSEYRATTLNTRILWMDHVRIYLAPLSVVRVADQMPT